jgi:hypothetical protein
MSAIQVDPLEHDVGLLSQCFSISLDESYQFVIVQGVMLPPGYNRDTINVLIELPADYPLSPPGLGDCLVYVSAGLLFHGRKLAMYWEQNVPEYPTHGFGPWAWLCYEMISWDPESDDLITFVEMLRADLTNPTIE